MSCHVTTDRYIRRSAGDAPLRKVLGCLSAESGSANLEVPHKIPVLLIILFISVSSAACSQRGDSGLDQPFALTQSSYSAFGPALSPEGTASLAEAAGVGTWVHIEMRFSILV